MRYRFLLGAGAWLLGALMATGGSFLAVNSLAHGLLGMGAQPVAVTNFQGEVDHLSSSSQPAPTLSIASAGDGNDQGIPASPRQPAVTATPQVTAAPSPASGGSLIVSPGGTVTASCQSGLAYLQYWSPNPGYQAGDVVRGPAVQASIGFEHLTSEFQITVTCKGSQPVAHVTAG